jgi:TolB-like protein
VNCSQKSVLKGLGVEAEIGRQEIYEFAGFRLEPAEHLLRMVETGEIVSVGPRAFDALVYFVERQGRLIDKTALMKALWPRTVVEENSLTQTISTLRRALGEKPGEQRFIATVAGRGYRFVAPVSAVAAAVVASELAVSQTVSAAEKSVAVMPFACFTGDPEKEYFGDGVAEELIHLLARIPGLKVPARTSSFAYKGRHTDVRQVARDLGVATVLEGSVRSAGDRIRVTAQLIDGRSGYHLWSRSFDRKFDDIFKLQDELAGAILQTLEVNISGRMPATVLPEPPTPSVAAYQLYLQGRGMIVRGDPVSLHAALRCFEMAISVDPKFARAYAGFSIAQTSLVSMGAATESLLSDAERNAQCALALNPELSDVYASLSLVSAYRGRWIDCEKYCRKALALNPLDPIPYNIEAQVLLSATGRLRASLLRSQESRRLGPGDSISALGVAIAQTFLCQDSDALGSVQLAVDLGMPRSTPPLPFIETAIAMNAGRHTEAAEHVITVLPPEIRAAGGEAVVRLVYAAAAGAAERRSAIEALRALRAGAARVAMTRPVMMMLSINWFTRLGALDLAYDLALTTLDDFDSTGVLSGTIHVATYWLPEMRPFRQDARFHGVVERLGLMEYWQQNGPPDECDLQDGTLICH